MSFQSGTTLLGRIMLLRACERISGCEKGLEAARSLARQRTRTNARSAGLREGGLYVSSVLPLLQRRYRRATA